MSDNIYIVLGLYGETLEPVAITDSETEYDDYVNTRNMHGLKTLVINKDHPKCPPIKNIYNQSSSIVDYFEDCPITKEEEEMCVQAESDIHTHMLSQLSHLRDEINKNYIKFSKDELRDIAEMIAIFRNHISICCDEDACYDISEEMNFKELLKHSKMMKVPFKE